MKLLSIVIKLIIIGVAGMVTNSIAALNDKDSVPIRVLMEKSKVVNNPVSAEQTLENIKIALEQDLFLSDDFYHDGNLKFFFGDHYYFKSMALDMGVVKINFDDLGNVYVDDAGRLNKLGKNMPCFDRGSISFYSGKNSHKSWVSIGIVTSARATSTSSFYADIVGEIFGIPNSVTEGYPTTPPLHGRTYVLENKTHALGNSWMNYYEEHKGVVAKIKFRTLGDGAVAEIQIFVGNK